jgi:hypothetical protein
MSKAPSRTPAASARRPPPHDQILIANVAKLVANGPIT